MIQLNFLCIMIPCENILVTVSGTIMVSVFYLERRIDIIMKSIEIKELEKLDSAQVTIVDVRSQEDYNRNTIPYAVNIPMEEFRNGLPDLDKAKPIYVLCHTGEKSETIVEQLEEAGYDATNISGGYRAFLRLQLSRMVQEEASIEEKTKEIERSLIKKFRKTSDVIEYNIFKSVYNINLRKVIGYQKDEKNYNFLDDYESLQ